MPQQVAEQVAIVAAWRDKVMAKVFAGDTSAALATAETIHALCQPQRNPALDAQCDWTFGNLFALTSRAAESLRHYAAAERYFLAAGESLNLARMRVGMLWALNLNGEYEHAFNLGEAAWPILANSDDAEDRRRLAGLANNLGIVCKNLGRYEEAIDYYDRKLALSQTWFEGEQQQIATARTHINLGSLKKKLGMWVEARQHLEIGRDLLRAAAPDRYRIDLARAEMHLGHLFAQTSRAAPEIAAAFDRARRYAADFSGLLSLSLYELEWKVRAVGAGADVLPDLHALRAAAETHGMPQLAALVDALIAETLSHMGQLDDALAGYAQIRETGAAINDWEIQYQAWQDTGRLLSRMNRAVAAEDAFRQAVRVLEGVRDGISDINVRQSFFDNKLSIYQDLIGFHLGRSEFGAAFDWSERMRARSLVEALGRRNGVYAQKPPRALHTVTPREIMPTLSADTCFLSFAAVDTDIWVFPIVHDAMLTPVCLGPSPEPADIERELSWIYNVRHFGRTLLDRRAAALAAGARRPLAAWYEQLLRPLQPILARYARLVITLDGWLSRLPVHAFYDAAGGHYLVETHTVSYVPSATVRHMNLLRDYSRHGGVIVAWNGPDTPHTAIEAAQLRRIFPDFTARLDDEARAEVLASAEAARAGYLHLATHGVFRHDNPLFSYVALADGRLEALDILKLKLSARLVTLSACETGKGLARGGEYLGLAFAFLLAGAAGVLGTHWPVDDEVTAHFMRDFYTRLSDTVRIDSALRDTQRAFIHHDDARYRHPYYWAPFFFYGVDPVA